MKSSHKKVVVAGPLVLMVRMTAWWITRDGSLDVSQASSVATTGPERTIAQARRFQQDPPVAESSSARPASTGIFSPAAVRQALAEVRIDEAGNVVVDDRIELALSYDSEGSDSVIR